MDFEEKELENKVLEISPPTTNDENDPRALYGLKFIKPLQNDDFREKCGEVFVENGKYTLMCKFCQVDHENLDVFIEHMVEHLLPKIETLDSDISSDCKSEDEIEITKTEVENKDNFAEIDENRNFDLKKIRVNPNIFKNDNSVNNRPTSNTLRNSISKNIYRNHNGYRGFEPSGYGNEEFGNNTIECVPDLGMFYDFDSPVERNHQVNVERNHQVNENFKFNENNWNNQIKSAINFENSSGNKTIDGRFHCYMCDKSYQYSKSLKEHIDLIHNCTEKSFKCPTCDKAFSKQWKLNTHLKVHTDERPYLCNICVMTFKWKKNLSRHLIRVHNVRLSDIRPEEYNLNLINNKNDKSPTVEENNAETFNNHLYKSSFGKRNDINDFPIIKNLLREKTSNQNLSPKSPDIERSNFLHHSIKKEKLDDDEDENHQFATKPIAPLNDSQQTLMTRRNSLISPTKSNLTPKEKRRIFFHGNRETAENGLVRIKTEPESDNEYNYNYNNKRSTRSEVFKYNSKSIKQNSNNVPEHKTENNPRELESILKSSGGPLVPNKDGFYSCRTCSKVYLRKDSLRAHERVHSAGLNCEYCGKSFSHKFFLERHVRTHTGEKPFHCHLCSASFVEENTLRNHIKFHIGDKRFACQFCSKRFIKQYEKIEHERNAHNNQIPPYSCEFCLKYFSHIKTLRYHKKVCSLNPKSKSDSTLKIGKDTVKDNIISEKQNLFKKTNEIRTHKDSFSSSETFSENINNIKRENEINLDKSFDMNCSSDKEQEDGNCIDTSISNEHFELSHLESDMKPENQSEFLQLNENDQNEFSAKSQQQKSIAEEEDEKENEEDLLQPLQFDGTLKDIENEGIDHQPYEDDDQSPPHDDLMLQPLTVEDENHHDNILQTIPIDNIHVSQHITNTQQLQPNFSHHPQLQHQQHLQQHQQQQQHLQHQSHPAAQYSTQQQHLHHNPHHQFQLAHSLDLAHQTDQLHVEQSFQQHQLQHYHNFQHQFNQHQVAAAAAAAHLQAPSPQIQIQQYHPQQFNFQPHTQYLAAATHPQAYYPQQYHLQQHPAAHLQHPQQYESQQHLGNQIAYVHDSFS